MSSLIIALLVFACIFGGALLGMLLSMILPEHHLCKESRETVKVGAGLIATMAALVLGLLVGSAKSSFDAMDAGMTEVGAKVILLDRVLARYGPETADIRDALRGAVAATIRKFWPEDALAPQNLEAAARAKGVEPVQARIMELTPKTDMQRLLQSQAVQLSGDLAYLRWMLIERKHRSLPTTFIVMLSFWLSMLFCSFGLFTPRHATVITVLGISALSVAGALFLILEMNSPLEGVIKISSGPLQTALSHLGKGVTP